MVGSCPETTRTLASLGAEVIKVEWRENPDPLRFGSPSVPLAGESIAEIRPLGFREKKFGPNRSGIFNNVNAGKMGITLNVKHPKGLELLKRLISISDVVIENFSAGVMEKWGLVYDSLKEIKKEIIYLSMSGLGHTGRNKNYVTMGPVVQALSGLTANCGLPGRAPAGWGFSYMDYAAGYFGTLAALYAIFHKKRSGEGQYIDLSQVECGILMNGLAMLNYSANRQPFRRADNPPGNHSQYGRGTLQNIYRCKGEDKWCAMSVSDESEWRGLCNAIGNPEWTCDIKFKDQISRFRNQDEFDHNFEYWTLGRSSDEVQATLQRNGVPAGKVQNAEDRFNDPETSYRGLFVPLQNTEIGERPILQIPMKFRRIHATIGGKLHRAAPVLGEDNEYVYQKILGLSKQETDSLISEGVL